MISVRCSMVIFLLMALVKGKYCVECSTFPCASSTSCLTASPSRLNLVASKFSMELRSATSKVLSIRAASMRRAATARCISSAALPPIAGILRPTRKSASRLSMKSCPDLARAHAFSGSGAFRLDRTRIAFPEGGLLRHEDTHGRPAQHCVKQPLSVSDGRARGRLFAHDGIRHRQGPGFRGRALACFGGRLLRGLGTGSFLAWGHDVLQIDNDEGGMMFRRPWIEACAVKA